MMTGNERSVERVGGRALRVTFKCSDEFHQNAEIYLGFLRPRSYVGSSCRSMKKLQSKPLLEFFSAKFFFKNRLRLSYSVLSIVQQYIMV